MSTTRATSKMEELMAGLLDRMEQQNEQLLEKMEQQNEQLRLLTQQQSDRVDDIGQRQKETDQEVSAIARELSSMKTAVDGRLIAMEGSVAGLTGQLRTEVAESQELLKRELREDLLEELSATSGLRSTARPFLPSAGASLDAVGEGTVRASDATALRGSTINQQRPAPFEGKLPWDAYRTQFELLADINRWSNAEKAAYLAISLRGPAATVLTNLPPEKRQDYGALTAALDSRFGVAHQTELNRMRLKARTRRREESLAELAEDVERLVRLAYPEADEAMVEVLAQDQFIDALPEEDIRLRIRQNKPTTLRDALRMALELESYQLACGQRGRWVREAQLENDHPVQRQASMSEAGEDVLRQLVEALHGLARPRRRSADLPTSRGGRNPDAEKTLVCWECNEKGHRRRQCPRLRKRQQKDDSGSPPGNGD